MGWGRRSVGPFYSRSGGSNLLTVRPCSGYRDFVHATQIYNLPINWVSTGVRQTRCRWFGWGPKDGWQAKGSEQISIFWATGYTRFQRSRARERNSHRCPWLFIVSVCSRKWGSHSKKLWIPYFHNYAFTDQFFQSGTRRMNAKMPESRDAL